MTDLDQRGATGPAIYRGTDRPTSMPRITTALRWPTVRSGWRVGANEVPSFGHHLAPGSTSYGARSRARLDYFPCGKKQAPLFVFIHGGYWQRNEKETFAFVADGPRAHGIDVAVPGYTLAPQARLTDIVEEIHGALTWLSQGADHFGFDREAVFVGGWSAGGHLTAAVAELSE
jgi:acetyl esterase/lipase